ncbi:MFS transporter [Solicola gregarius]|uniref:MFS transporter n=1 Tax=Solicola gregarius TaxID=2908642 RepID=A0AA46TG59_9ACTN|nr:MFS transporter [Solicola gregarius]UYM04645.1 MFS transporter [Solicola gregarius]
MSTQTVRTTDTTQTRDRRWLALVVIAVAQLMSALDATIVNIALPTAQTALGFDDGARAWVVTAYTLPLAGLLLVAGRISDRIGATRALLVGLAGFAVSSAIAGAAMNLEMLIAGRAMQGAFAALMAPAGLALIGMTFTDQTERAKAFGVFGAVASSGAVIGLLIGGALTEVLDWRFCLYVNAPVAIAALIAGRAYLPSMPGRRGQRLDLTSAAMVTSGLVGVTLACTQAVEHGWTSPEVVVPGSAGIALVAGFLFRQTRIADPLLPLEVIANRTRAAAFVATASGVVGSFGMFLMLTYHFQVVLGYSAIEAGLAFVPMTLAVTASAYAIGSKLMNRVSPGMLIVPGLLTAAVGLLLLWHLSPTSGYLTSILPAEILVGIGMGSATTPAFSVAIGGVDRRLMGVASAVANTGPRLGGTLGTAVLNTIAVSATSDAIASGTAPTEAVVHGYATAAACAAGLLVAAAALVAYLFASTRR